MALGVNPASGTPEESWIVDDKENTTGKTNNELSSNPIDNQTNEVGNLIVDLLQVITD